MTGVDHMFLSLSDENTVIIDGVPAWQYRLCLAERPHIPVPERDIESQEVLGRMGDYYDKYEFNDMEITLTFNYLEDIQDYKPFKEEFPFIRKWLERGEKLQFGDLADVYYLIQKVHFKSDVVNDMIEYGEFDVTLTLSPFGRFEEQWITIPASPFPNLYELEIYNASTEKSYPLFRVTVTNTDGSFYINTNAGGTASSRANYPYEVEVTNRYALARTYEIDCFKQTVALDLGSEGKQLTANYLLKRGGFPRLESGVNGLRITTTGSAKITNFQFKMGRLF